ncbi:hypothetical protein GDO86_005649 [Hymenochirus boettgeri]|uniref:Methyltransferase domain-containing protein n=1 Tax=Hymenochirus boettgeri TaxID=247094 RepID=A0A8T2JAT0_9PIPI|nr:hypothetical protein GDO86_005649 [Hymenochirus boettgeri]
MFPSLSTTNTDHLKETVGKLLQFLQGTRQISEAHTVDFYTKNVWKNLVAVSPDRVLLVLQEDGMASHQKKKEVPDISCIFSDITHHLVNIEAFAAAAHYYSLVNLGACISVEDLLEALSIHKAGGLEKEMKINQFMNIKKSHEVLIMSQLVESIARKCGVKQVIDLGAGKGYLSSYLSMRYDLEVYGIDSSDSNTDGANKRNRKLKKYWKAYKRNPSGTSKGMKSEQEKDCLLPSYLCQEVNTDREILESKPIVPSLEGLSISDLADDEKNMMSGSNNCQIYQEIHQSVFQIQTLDLDRSSCFLDILPSDAVEESPFSENIGRCFTEQEKEQRKLENLKTKEWNESRVYSTLTCEVTTNTDLNDIIGTLEESVIVGLHTCGDLAPNTLRIFVTKPEIKAVCSVGCCYHLLTEELDMPEEENSFIALGFPMSHLLKESGWIFGRNARMSACLALERVAVGQGPPTESLFYRAVLQVICKEYFGGIQSDKRVGKVFSKSASFTDYVRRCLKKLGNDDLKLSDEKIMEYYETYKPRKNELEAFNMLKILLAPCIEALILLDRLCYLKEQSNLAWSGLVKLFDPVKSPRCYAVVSVKK